MGQYFKNLKSDLTASIILFFVALPLCLGIALASDAPLFAGIIAGVIGGIVVGSCSGSALGVSGPAAGLVAIILSSMALLGNSWEAFLLAVVLAGIFQVIIGYIGGGIIAYYFPSSVIKGMLAGIGIIIILKQVMYALGLDPELEGELVLRHLNEQNFFAALTQAIHSINPGALLITLLSLFILIMWELDVVKRYKIFQVLQGPLVVVIVGIFLNCCFQADIFTFKLDNTEVVNVPVSVNLSAFFKQFSRPDFSQLTNINVYKVALTIAVIASIETLLCVEATDKLDPDKRITPTNRELKAQGVGNIISGLVGGLPVTQVIIRSSANINFGAKTKMSTILHGIFLLLCAVYIPHILNMIPLASLASILFVIGYKLAKPALFIHIYKLGWEQFVPFVATILGMIFADLLTGVGIGMGIGLFIILRHNFNNPYYILKNGHRKDGEYTIQLAEEVSFLNKGSILQELNSIPRNAKVLIDGTNSKAIDYDVKEIIQDFLNHAATKNIKVELKGINS